jgi:DNA repair protein RadA/Sms
MGADGLRESDPAGFLSPGQGEVGSALSLPLAGRRAFALEVQALAMPTEGPARRQATGLDPRRFALVAAVVDRAVGVRLAGMELFGATAGGIRVDDPACDLAVAVALASSATGRPAPPGAAFVGEVSLTGQVRPVPGLPQRLAAAARGGARVVYAAAEEGVVEGVRVASVRHVSDALGWIREEMVAGEKRGGDRRKRP